MIKTRSRMSVTAGLRIELKVFCSDLKSGVDNHYTVELNTFIPVIMVPLFPLYHVLRRASW